MNESGSFQELDRVHEQLAELFAKQQEAVLAFDLPLAARLFRQFERGLRLHARQEDRWLLPAYEQWRLTQGSDHAVAAKVFESEHRLMLSMARQLRGNIQALVGCPPPTARQIIELLDAQCSFKRLVEHHSTREHNILFPCLDRALTRAGREDWLRRCTRYFPLSSEAMSTSVRS
jgi:iron-sulfur cluster repair protein YtfE (RIC family)